MKTINAKLAQENFYDLLQEVSDEDKAVKITGKQNEAVLLSLEHWTGIQETIFLLSIPGMGESIINGMKEHVSYSID